MAEKIFDEVSSVSDLANLLQAFAEDDFVKYDRDSRIRVRDELAALCKKFGVSPPEFFGRIEKSQDLFDELAALRGIVPQSPLDYLNMEYDADFNSYAEFRRWLEANAATAALVNDARKSMKDADDMNEFLSTGII